MLLLPLSIIPVQGEAQVPAQEKAQFPAQEVAQIPAQEKAPDYSAYILTPKAPDTPRINGPKIYGARPGSPFLFRIPATGIRPMTFEAKGLPKGLKLDPQTGIITGKAKKRGTYEVALKATNALGTAERAFKIVIGDKIALTPPMGWSAWNCWGAGITQEHCMETAKAFLEKDLVNYGWTYVNIDDGWQSGKRGGKYNAILPNKTFPDMKGLADYLHANGLKLGIYSAPWVGTYCNHIGSSCDDPDGKYWWVEQGDVDEYGRVDNTKSKRDEVWYFGKYSFARQDALQWAEWGVDYLKYDWNIVDSWWLKDMRDALLATGRDIVYSISNHVHVIRGLELQQYAETWRTGGDIRDNWKSLYNNGVSGRNEWWGSFTGPGSWPDADMLVVGKVGWGKEGKRDHELHWTKLTPDEQYTHITLWSILGSTMMIGCDMSELDDFTLSLLTNNEVIDVNQDPLGIQGIRYVGDNTYVTYIKPLEDGSLAVAMINLSDEPKKIGFRPHSLALIGRQTIRDLWRQQDIAEVGQTERWETEVAPHGTVFVKVTPEIKNERLTGKYPYR